jgi:hypothetical protein
MINILGLLFTIVGLFITPQQLIDFVRNLGYKKAVIVTITFHVPIDIPKYIKYLISKNINVVYCQKAGLDANGLFLYTVVLPDHDTLNAFLNDVEETKKIPTGNNIIS